MLRDSRVTVVGFLTAAGLFLTPARSGAQYIYPYPFYPIPYVASSAVRIEATPKNAEVYVDGYYAGVVDDFDGVFQRLYVRPGPHEIMLYLEGYHAVREQLYLTPDKTHKIQTTLQPLAPGEENETRPTPQVPPAGQPPLPPPGERMPPPPNEPVPTQPTTFGTLAIRVQPVGAEILVDGERWEGPVTVDERILVQVAEGSHHIEVQKEGYVKYTTDVQVRRGETVDLNVSLPRSH